jgi:hypothetical protein
VINHSSFMVFAQGNLLIVVLGATNAGIIFIGTIFVMISLSTQGSHHSGGGAGLCGEFPQYEGRLSDCNMCMTLCGEVEAACNTNCMRRGTKKR